MSAISLWSERKTEIALFVGALILRFVWFISVEKSGGSWLVHDSHQFLLLAQNLSDSGIFSRSTAPPFFPDIARTPGYPLWLYLLSKLHFSVSGIAGVQLILSAFIPVLLYQTSRKFGFSTPLLAGILAAVDFSLVLFAPYILSDGLFLFLLALFLKLISEVMISGKKIMAAGLILSALILVRPIAQFLPFCIAAWWIYRKVTRRHITLFLISSLLIPAVWAGRNYTHFHVFTLSSMGTNNLLLYNAAGVLAEVNQQDLTVTQTLLARSAKEQQDWTNDPNATKKYLQNARNKAIKIIGDHPFIFLKQSLRSAVLLPFKPARSYIDLALKNQYSYAPIQGLNASNTVLNNFLEAWNNTSPVARWLMLYQIILNVLVFALAVHAVWQNGIRHPFIRLLLLMLCYFWVTSLVTQPDARFRLPLALILMLIASAGNYHILKTMLFGHRPKNSHPAQ